MLRLLALATYTVNKVDTVVVAEVVLVAGLLASGRSGDAVLAVACLLGAPAAVLLRRALLNVSRYLRILR